MRHPSDYTTIPLGALHIMEVDAGTVITDERSGQFQKVDDDNFVVKGNVVFCTAKTYEALKARAALKGDNDAT